MSTAFFFFRRRNFIRAVVIEYFRSEKSLRDHASAALGGLSETVAPTHTGTIIAPTLMMKIF